MKFGDFHAMQCMQSFAIFEYFKDETTNNITDKHAEQQINNKSGLIFFEFLRKIQGEIHKT